jgi:hypothetical protein
LAAWPGSRPDLPTARVACEEEVVPAGELPPQRAAPDYGGRVTRKLAVRIGVDERRSRLVRRHRLAVERRSGTPSEVAESLVALHSTDPATVFLSTWARSLDFRPEALEEALYDEQALVRMLGMRRTLWVVPRELAAVVHAACTRAIASRERKRLVGFVAESGVAEDAEAFLDDAAAAALGAVEARGEAFTSDVTADEPALATKLRLGAGSRWEAQVSTASRVLPLLAAEGRLMRGRPRTSWTNGQYRWAPTRA